MILRAYKTELDPTAEQRSALASHVAGARVAHNWVLEQWRAHDAARAIARGARALAGQDIKGGEAACVLAYGLSALTDGVPVKVRTPKGTHQRYRYRAPSTTQIPDFAASTIDWYARFIVVRDEQPERFGWISGLSSFAIREAVLDVADAWKRFFEHLKAKRYARAGEPRFRNIRHAGYHADQPDPIRVTDRAVKIPGVGWVRLKERNYLPETQPDSHRFKFGGKACGLGISERDGRWYVALRCEVPDPRRQKRGPGRALRDCVVPRVKGRRMGVENGVRVLAVGYDGDSADLVKESGLRDDLRIERIVRLRQLWERRMARRWVAGHSTRDQSVGWKEAARRVRHYHARIVDIRDDRVGKVVRKIVDRGAETVLLREPHVAELLDRRTAPDARTRNRLAPAVHGARMGDLRERLQYKQAWAGGGVELVDKFEPVTKKCSSCGAVRDTTPDYPNFVCEKCGHREDRDDANAPKNLYSGGSSPGAASPRSAGSKTPERGHNGHEKRTARAKEEQSPLVTAPHRSGNRARPGAPRSARPNDSHHDPKFDRSGDVTNGSAQFGADTAKVRADDRNLSQTVSQEHESIAGSGDGLEPRS